MGVDSLHLCRPAGLQQEAGKPAGAAAEVERGGSLQGGKVAEKQAGALVEAVGREDTRRRRDLK